MAEAENLSERLRLAIRSSGINVTKDFCHHIVDKFTEKGIDLREREPFRHYVKELCINIREQSLFETPVGEKHLEKALEICLHAEHEQVESVFNVISAFNFPKLVYDIDRKQFHLDSRKGTLLSSAETKARLFQERYEMVLQRTKRNFSRKMGTDAYLEIQTVDYLLTVKNIKLKRTVILGAILQVSERNYYLEDPTGMVKLDLAHASFPIGLVVENEFVMINGLYDDKVLKVSMVIIPPAEEYKESRHFFSNLNYFGGPSPTPLRDSAKLKEHMQKNSSDMILFFSNVWLDSPVVFEKLDVLFGGLSDSPPIAFVFMGNFMSESFSNEKMDTLRKLFKRLADLIITHPTILNSSKFIFVPGPEDPSISHMVPRFGLPVHMTSEFSKAIPGAIFATNPCRIQYCTREIVLFRADVLPKLLQGALHKPDPEELPERLTRTIVGQGHLSPLPLNALTVHWDFDHTLRLYPLPDLVVIGDKAELYQHEYKGCTVINPGSFCDNGFQFKSYIPYNGSIDDCVL